MFWIVAIGTAALLAWLLSPARPLTHTLRQTDFPAHTRGFVAHLAIGATMEVSVPNSDGRLLFRKTSSAGEDSPLTFEVPRGAFPPAVDTAIAEALRAAGFDLAPSDESFPDAVVVTRVAPVDSIRIIECAREALALPLHTVFDVRFSGRQSFSEFRQYLQRHS